VAGELGNTGLLRALLPGVDVAFHLASTTLPATSNDAPVFDVQSNLVDTLRLLETCAGCAVGKVVFLSSGGTVYGQVDAAPVAEDHATTPICSYGIVKLAIEHYLRLFHRTAGLRYAVLRPSNPFGPRQNPEGNQGAVAVFLGRIARGEPVTIWGDGEIVRDYFHVSDLARAIVLAARSPKAELTLNVGSGAGLSLNQLVARLGQLTGKPVTVVREPARPLDVPRLVLDTHRARTELGWAPSVPLDAGLAQTWEWVSQEWPSR
jgi:UDP-glucose 4-epimerase